MRRTATILAVVLLMGVSSSGVALAAYEDLITGTDGNDIISGTGKSEHISGLGGDDRVNGNGGADNLIGQGGDTSPDRFYADSGRDTIQLRDVPADKDTVECGAGTDTVYADKADVVADDCEQVRAW